MYSRVFRYKICPLHLYPCVPNYVSAHLLALSCCHGHWQTNDACGLPGTCGRSGIGIGACAFSTANMSPQTCSRPLLCFSPQGSFRGALSPAPQKASATSPRKRGAENAVVHFFRTIVSSELNLWATLRDSRVQRAPAQLPDHAFPLLVVFVFFASHQLKTFFSLLSALNYSSGVPRPSEI